MSYHDNLSIVGSDIKEALTAGAGNLNIALNDIATEVPTFVEGDAVKAKVIAAKIGRSTELGKFIVELTWTRS